MQEQTYVSVIIPCYNSGHFIREAIASVEQCERETYELIIVDDGSTDVYTQHVLSDLGNEGYQIINKTNQGPASARNTGIRAATSNYILPVDADNRIRPNYIYKGLEILNKLTDVSVVYGIPDYFGEKRSFPFNTVREFDLFGLLQTNYIDTCAVFRKLVWQECGGYDTHALVQGLEDWDFWLTLALRGHQFFFLNEIVFDYRVRPDSMTHELQQGRAYELAVEYLAKKHLAFGLYQQMIKDKKRLIELENFVAVIQRNPVFRAYHWLKYFGRE